MNEMSFFSIIKIYVSLTGKLATFELNFLHLCFNTKWHNFISAGSSTKWKKEQSSVHNSPRKYYVIKRGTNERMSNKN